ncbi:MAG: VacJ family lipoprotein [Pseudomonadota bacterium]
MGILMMLWWLCGCATSDRVDPWEGFNRKVTSFNDGVDVVLLKPLATGYQAVTPDPVERGISNVFDNLDEPVTSLNQLLQAKPGRAFNDATRFVVNSTVGLLGTIDVATPMGLEKHNEDFGQTFAVWGIGEGPYLVLPFLGPSSPRAALGRIPDSRLDLLRTIDHVRTRNTIRALSLIDTRVELMGVEKLISGDRYLFIRDAYLQRRAYEIADGDIEDEFF